MKFICEKNKLQEVIGTIKKIINNKTSVLILNGIFIECKENEVTFIGYDKELGAEIKIEANVLEQGCVVIDAKILGEIVRKLPNGEVTLTKQENNTLKIECNRSRFEVIYMNSNEFPSLPKIEEENTFSIPQGLLKEMVKSTSFATAKDETRPVFQGVLFEVKDSNLSLVASDGYRLALRKENISNTNDISVIIPGKTLNEISKILNDENSILEITFTNNHILFNTGKTKIISRLLEGQFLSYNPLFLTEHKIIIDVNKQELLNGIERASLMSNLQGAKLVKLNISGNNIIITSDSQLGKVREEIEIETQSEDMQIAFNSKYLIEILKSLDEEMIQIKLTNSVSACIIKNKNSDNCKQLLLPVRT